MKFRVGPWTYRVRISASPLFDEHGRQQAGRCDWAARTILISCAIPVQQRADALQHELAHAWRFHFGRPDDAEGDASNLSSFTTMCTEELTRQGGGAALMRMAPEGTLVPSPAAAGELWELDAEARGAECGACQTKFAPGAIVTCDPILDENIRRLVVRRMLYCDFCGHVQMWFEGSTTTGKPNGQVIGEPVWRRGEEAAAFLREHGEKTGVVLA